jgi:hypothetical protein
MRLLGRRIVLCTRLGLIRLRRHRGLSGRPGRVGRRLRCFELALRWRVWRGRAARTKFGPSFLQFEVAEKDEETELREKEIGVKKENSVAMNGKKYETMLRIQRPNPSTVLYLPIVSMPHPLVTNIHTWHHTCARVSVPTKIAVPNASTLRDTPVSERTHRRVANASRFRDCSDQCTDGLRRHLAN